MAFGFPAFHTELIVFTSNNPSSDPRAILFDAIQLQNWLVVEAISNQMEAKSGVGIWSWGEKISIRFLAINEVEITSKCSLVTQCFDWGKNRANVMRLVTEMQKYGRLTHQY